MRYQGGKSRLAKYIAPFIDAELALNGGRYVEPFVGALNILPHLKNVKSAECSDLHDGLINMYCAMQEGWEPPSELDEFTYDVLKIINDRSPLATFASFGCAFAGEEWGSYAKSTNGRGESVNYADVSRRSLLRKWDKIPKTVCFKNCHYSELAPQRSVVYCDPPYRGTLSYSTSKSFDPDHFDRWCESLIGLGNTVLVSEFTAPDHWEVLWGKSRKITMHDSGYRTRTERLYKVRVK